MSHPATTCPHQQSPEELAAKAQAHHAEAMEALWERFQPLVRRLLRQYGGPDSAEDRVGDAYIALHQLTLAYDPTRGVPFAAYLQHKLSSTLYTLQRRERRQHQREIVVLPGLDLPELPSHLSSASPSASLSAPGTPCSDDIEQRVLQRLMLTSLLSELTPLQRFVFTQRAEYGKSYEEITATLGTSSEAARIVYHRACRRLRERLKESND